MAVTLPGSPAIDPSDIEARFLLKVSSCTFPPHGSISSCFHFPPLTSLAEDFPIQHHHF